ncbi:phosphoenolpyruvate--protein phosphotransferase [Photobacterium profundum]|uniref:phosphoenolpyruvate--protein phosphotransferase n=1 Tax=Photobacterium profundum TaxID=74109 RepID=UPI003D13D478
MLEIHFICPLPNGVHARPATEIELRANKFKSDITIENVTKKTSANAKSVLSMIGADILLGDECRFIIQGEDEQEAHRHLGIFVDQELTGIDSPQAEVTGREAKALPGYLSRTKPNLLRGSIAASGIGRGRPEVVGCVDLHALAAELPVVSLDDKVAAIDLALTKTRQDLEDQIALAGDDVRTILTAHLSILNDATLTANIEKNLGQCNAVAVIAATSDELCESLLHSESAYLRERALDIRDIASRLASNIVGYSVSADMHLTQDSVIISNSLLTPSQLLALPLDKIKGLVMGEGGDTSHTVILARSFGIPTLSGIKEAATLCRQASVVILDADIGALVIDPSSDTDRYYMLEAQKKELIERRLKMVKFRKIATKDHVPVNVSANIVTSGEIDTVLDNGADGVGLYRTEMLFCECSAPPSEQEQFDHYRRVIEKAQGKKVIIRTLDIGGDKPCEFMGFPNEENPFLGYRAIRMYSEYIEIIKNQFRALIRASQFGDVSIMVPMISNLDEIRWIRSLLDALRTELEQQGVAIGKVSLGIMVEVPSTLYLLEKSSEYIDFVSIGSNDLTQYFFACDRGNEHVAYLYNHRDPSFLALIRDIVARANSAGLDVSMCGEMAADPVSIPLLVGAGLQNFSMSASRIGLTKELVESLSQSSCQTLLEEAISSESSKAVTALVEEAFAVNQQKYILDESLIFTHQSLATKADVIKVLTDNLEVQQRTGTAADVDRDIWEREAIFSTALGFSVAVPHCKSEYVIHNSLSVMTLEKPISWGEGIDVEMIIMITVNKSDSDDTHMKVFSKIARKLMHEEFRNALLNASDRQDVLALMQETITV